MTQVVTISSPVVVREVSELGHCELWAPRAVAELRLLRRYGNHPHRVNMRAYVNELVSACLREPQLSPNEVGDLPERTRTTLRLAALEAAGAASDYRRLAGSALSRDERAYAAMRWRLEGVARRSAERLSPLFQSLREQLRPPRPEATIRGIDGASLARAAAMPPLGLRLASFGGVRGWRVGFTAQTKMRGLGDLALPRGLIGIDTKPLTFASKGLVGLRIPKSPLLGLKDSAALMRPTLGMRAYEDNALAVGVLGKNARGSFAGLGTPLADFVGLGRSGLTGSKPLGLALGESLKAFIGQPSGLTLPRIGSRFGSKLQETLTALRERTALWALVAYREHFGDEPVLIIVEEAGVEVALAYYEATEDGGAEALVDSLTPAVASPRVLEEMLMAVAEPPLLSDPTRAWLREGLRQLRENLDWRLAVPHLFFGLEGAYREAARAEGIIDGREHFTPKSGRSGKAGGVEALLPHLGLDPHRELLVRTRAYGAGNRIRHVNAVILDSPDDHLRRQVTHLLLALGIWLERFVSAASMDAIAETLAEQAPRADCE